MAYEKLGAQPLDYNPCRYGTSKLLFRGPKRRLEGNYAAFLGGTQTYGKFIAQPFPALTEAQTGVPCVNLGWSNAGLDVLLNEAEIIAAASRAAVTVLQVPGAQNLYPEVDFTEFHFIRHLLHHLVEVSEDRFAAVRRELQEAWIARMTLLLRRIEAPVVLLWMSGHAPHQDANDLGIAADPAFVTSSMLQAVRGRAARLIDASLSAAALAEGTDGMVHSEFEANIAAELPGPAAHRDVAQQLAPIVTQYAGQ
ncbi:hypothetical protein DC366_03810 [Pelagivirga sediminicola]|uniref:DUF6473 domain-containing protein n=1 Tax=Pelagivirga sediminicola TaxID=2170575 RepID=A0A2T7GAA4_9RHOB|nr:DUF6473 family protein [Pelagivirga sediminicola]PVA11351.1 hypothetical protein DC366_03810 [Pelagivirga sediminicola]